MEFLKEEFDLLKIKYIPSFTNFITTIWGNAETADLISKKLLEAGIIVRRLSSFGWENCIRITIGTKKENIILIKALKSFLDKV